MGLRISIEPSVSLNEEIGVTKRFLREDVGYGKVTNSSAVAIKPDSKWKITAEIEGIGSDRKEIIVDDKDGNMVSCTQARAHRLKSSL
jgi:hypothetical protein